MSGAVCKHCGKRVTSYWRCDTRVADDDLWCSACFDPETGCFGLHSEGCATHVIEAPEEPDPARAQEPRHAD